MAAAIARRAAATIPRHLAAATATATAAPTLSPAAVTATRPSSAIAFLRRRVHHTLASPEIDQRLSLLEKRVASLEAGATKDPVRQLDERVARLEVNPNNETARLLVEIDGKISSLELKMDKASFERYAKLQDGQTSLHGRYIQVSDQVRALAFASASRDVKADKQHVESLAQVKKSSWKVCWTVLLGASTVSLGVFNLLKAESRSENLKAAEELFNSKTAELEKSFNAKLESTVEHAVNLALALAHKALEASNVQDQPPPGGTTGGTTGTGGSTTTGTGGSTTGGTGTGGSTTGTGTGGSTS